MEPKAPKSWLAVPMMILSILAVCVVVPMGFIASDVFTRWLEAVGIRMTPNLAGGYPVASFTNFGRLAGSVPSGMDSSEVGRALAVRRFSVSKVAFRRFSGIGIAPRVNLCFEFEGKLPDPQNSPSRFSMTTMHVYLKTSTARQSLVNSARSARIDFEEPGWDFQVIIDGFHDQPMIYDTRGTLAARGLGLYVDGGAGAGERAGSGSGASSRTVVTAALPLDFLGDPSQGDWRFYVLVGLSDSRDPSMMLHPGPDAPPAVFCAALSAGDRASPGARPCLRALAMRNPS